jgi:hypothetical protein
VGHQDLMKLASCLAVLLLLPLQIVAQTPDAEVSSGAEIMQEVYRRHQQFPYIYEEQSMVLIDRQGNRDSRRARRYSRVEADGTTHFMLIFDYPEEVRGLSLLANRDAQGVSQRFVYLPAFAEQLIESRTDSGDSHFLGTDFSVEDLSGEVLKDYHYVRRQDMNLDGQAYFVIDVYDLDEGKIIHQKKRRHYVRKDIYYITITDHYDRKGKVNRQLSHHDLKAVNGDMWRANLILVEDKVEQHKSLIRIEKRVFSQQYVPAEMFSAEWLYQTYPYRPVPQAEDDIAQSESTQSGKAETGESGDVGQ